MTVRVRFAPSPTGYLHVGGARTALFNWMFAQKHQGTFILRIEDTDVERSSPEMVAGILEGLKWLELNWDEGPYYQSTRLNRYREIANQLLTNGTAYPCFCHPDELKERREAAQKQGKAWKYDRRCLYLDPAERNKKRRQGLLHAIRFRVPEAPATVTFKDHVHGELRFETGELEDFVLLRSDGQPTYQLAVVVDDHEMNITHVIRGDDHIANTPKQILLYHALGWTPPEFAHVPLILGPDRKRLSKRHGAVSVLQYREDGYLPQAMRNFLALLGWYPPDEREIQPIESMIRQFELSDINKGNPIFDVQKLLWMNAEYIRAMDAESLLAYLEPFLKQRGWWETVTASRPRYLERIELLKSRMRRLTDFLDLGEAFFTENYTIDPQSAKKRWKHPDLATHLKNLAGELEHLSNFSPENIETVVRGYAETHELKPAILIHGLRVALTGRSVGPGLFELMAVLGRETVLKRIDRRLPEIESYARRESTP